MIQRKFSLNDRFEYNFRVKSNGSVITFVQAIKAIRTAYPTMSLTEATVKFVDLINEGKIYELVPIHPGL